MFAIIETGSKQYKVKTGDTIRVEKLEGEKESAVVFDRVLMVADGENVSVGDPTVQGAKVEGKLIETKKGKKLIVFKYHSKTRYKKKKGHRQEYTAVHITAIKAK